MLPVTHHARTRNLADAPVRPTLATVMAQPSRKKSMIEATDALVRVAAEERGHASGDDHRPDPDHVGELQPLTG